MGLNGALNVVLTAPKNTFEKLNSNVSFKSPSRPLLWKHFNILSNPKFDISYLDSWQFYMGRSGGHIDYLLDLVLRYSEGNRKQALLILLTFRLLLIVFSYMFLHWGSYQISIWISVLYVGSQTVKQTDPRGSRLMEPCRINFLLPLIPSGLCAFTNFIYFIYKWVSEQLLIS